MQVAAMHADYNPAISYFYTRSINAMGFEAVVYESTLKKLNSYTPEW